jgi:signal transduction histidine kinase
VARKTTPTKSRQPEITGRLQEIVDSGDTRELARRSMTLQAVMLDLHRQLAGAESQADLARGMGLALTGSFACERLVVLRRERNRPFESVAEIGDVPAALHEEAPALASRLAPFLPHVAPLAPLLPPFAEVATEPAQRLAALGFVRAAWLNVERQIDWLVFVGPKLSGAEYDTFDVSLLRATLDAAALASSKLLLVDALEERNHELEAANRRLLQIDDLKSAILAGVSHELRTPLTRIQMYAEALRDETPAPDEKQEFCSIILDNARTLATRIDESLQFAAVIGGRSTPQPEQVALRDVVQAVVDAHAATAEARSVRLECGGDPLAVFTDPAFVRMIVGCLVDNAVKFTPPGGEVGVQVESFAAGASVRISDTGKGISETALDRIWRPLEHGESTLERRESGLGLGLALAKRLALELGASLELLNSSAAGSTFGLFFPDAAPATALEPARARVVSLQR